MKRGNGSEGVKMPRRSVRAAAMLAVLLLGAGCGQGGGAADSPAEAVYKQRCLNCHGADLRGRSGIPDLRDAGDRLSLEDIRFTIEHGARGMPAFRNTLKEEEIVQLTEWLAGKKE